MVDSQTDSLIEEGWFQCPQEGLEYKCSFIKYVLGRQTNNWHYLDEQTLDRWRKGVRDRESYQENKTQNMSLHLLA